MKQILALFLFFQVFTFSAYAQQYKYHIVKQGETLSSISGEYNITEETILKYNPDARNGITPNSKLVVPLVEAVREEEVEFKTHRVKRKETLWRLSQQYNVSIENIKRYNKKLYSEELKKGDKVRIPVNIPKAEDFVKEETPKNPLDLSIREHVVLPKETKYGISKKYEISIEELEELNPQADTLRPGMVLKIASSKDSEATALEDKIFQYYLVQPQETLFSLTRRLGISKDSLIILNPALAEGLKAGMVLKIPNMGSFESGIDFTAEEIVNLESRITNFSTKNLVVMLPFHLDRVKNDSAANPRGQLRRDKVMQLSLDFYSGVLMAVDSAKSHGISTDLRFFDTRQNSKEVEMIINTNDFTGVDAVIGPLVQSTVEAAARKLQRDKIPVISPITKKETKNLENFVQTRPTDEMLAEVMISYIAEKVEGKNMLIVANPLAVETDTKLRIAFPEATRVYPKEGSIDQEQLIEALVEDEENWVILESGEAGVLSSATSYLNSVASEYKITLFTTNRNKAFDGDDVSNMHLSRLNFHFPSVDKEYEILKNPFMTSYTKKYGMAPNTYAVRGFDVTYDILLRLATADDLEDSMKEKGTTEYAENKFDYEKSTSGGYFNKAIYIMAFGKDMELKVVR